MKQAERNDVWRHVGSDWRETLRIVELDIRDMPGIEPGKVELTGGLSLLCGVNGSGKSRLLGAIADSVENGDSSKVHVETSEQPTEVAYIDTFWLLQRQRISFGTDQSLDDRIQQAGFTSFRAPEVRLASYLLGRQYEKIDLAELESTDDTNEIEQESHETSTVHRALTFRSDALPYFVTRRNGQDFTSLDLSQGELAGLTLIWAMRQVNKSSIIIIDEPETFMSPLSSKRSLDVVAFYVDKNRAPCLVTSHSYLGLAAVPKEHLVLLHPSSPGMVQLRNSDERTLWKTLRLAAPKAILFVVEDEAARQWLTFLLRSFDFPHLELVDIWIAGDSSKVRQAALFPDKCRGATMSIWGVLDGDEREKAKAKGNIIFLPGKVSPEQVILDTLTSESIEINGIARSKAQEMLAAHEGENPHDAILAIASDAGLAVAAFRHATLNTWLKETEDGQAAAAEFIESLNQVKLPELRPDL
ncbi:AAA family ATPase [Amycolatopsis sp. NBC_01307]|uniref:AAA family ATPase n=1 Tax=Amycolatopsis sp. NBC_01307 TaxID=2903561 RepID=UPI002E0D5DA3|nr:AAA family ATPase [Amycolatopsis sp. NBC_01307]